MEKITSERTSGFVRSVESVRGLAALIVAIAHAMGFILLAPYRDPVFNIRDTRDLILKLIFGVFDGQMAVTVFFVISGFVIGRSLDKKSTSRPLQSYTTFLTTRAFRLYPAHLVALCGVILMAAMVFVGASPIDFSPYQPLDDKYFEGSMNGTVFNPLRLTSIIGNAMLLSWSLNLVVWSLYVELCIAPVLPVFHKASRVNNALMDTFIVAGLLGISLAAWGNVWIQYAFIFYLGMLVQTRGREWAEAVARHVSPGLAAFASWLVMMAPSLVMMDRPPLVVVIEAFAAFSLISLIVWPGRSKAFQFLDNPVLRWNGRISYSFYLWHYFILSVSTRELYAHLSPETMHTHQLALFTITLIGTVAVALFIAHLSYSFVEVPFISVGRRVVAMWKPITVPTAAEPATTAAS